MVQATAHRARRRYCLCTATWMCSVKLFVHWKYSYSFHKVFIQHQFIHNGNIESVCIYSEVFIQSECPCSENIHDYFQIVKVCTIIVKVFMQWNYSLEGQPPDTGSVSPVIYLASSERRNTMAEAISSGSASLYKESAHIVVAAQHTHPSGMSIQSHHSGDYTCTLTPYNGSYTCTLTPYNGSYTCTLTPYNGSYTYSHLSGMQLQPFHGGDDISTKKSIECLIRRERVAADHWWMERSTAVCSTNAQTIQQQQQEQQQKHTQTRIVSYLTLWSRVLGRDEKYTLL